MLSYFSMGFFITAHTCIAANQERSTSEHDMNNSLLFSKQIDMRSFRLNSEHGV